MARIYYLFIILLSTTVILAQDKIGEETKKTCCSESSSCPVLTSGIDMSGICQKACAVQDYDPKAVVSILDAKIGDLTTCPVSGVVFEVTANSSKVNFDGKDVYFCCASCTAMYNSYPNHYVENIKTK